jgi:hypothetical protein
VTRIESPTLIFTGMKITLICLLLTMTSVAMAQTSKGKDYYLLVGTYTNEAKTNGIHVYTFNTGTGDFQEKSITTGITNPSYIAISKDRRMSTRSARLGKERVSMRMHSTLLRESLHFSTAEVPVAMVRVTFLLTIRSSGYSLGITAEEVCQQLV